MNMRPPGSMPSASSRCSSSFGALVVVGSAGDATGGFDIF